MIPRDMQDCADQPGQGESAEQEHTRNYGRTKPMTAPQTRDDLTFEQRVEETYARYGYARGSIANAEIRSDMIHEMIKAAIDSGGLDVWQTTISREVKRLRDTLLSDRIALDSDELIGYFGWDTGRRPV